MMKTSILFWPITMAFTMAVACGIARDASDKGIGNEIDANVVTPQAHEGDPTSWDVLFRKIPGVEVRGNYPALSLRIRGAQSINLTTEPLFVLEGVPLGHDFASLDRATAPHEVKSIRILKGAEATMYGARGANGVVLVTLK